MNWNINTLKYLAGTAMAFVLASCDNYLDAPTKSSLDESVIFSSPDLAKGALDGIKVPFAETNSYRGRFLPWYGMNTDTEWYNSSENVGNGQADLAVYATEPNNNQMNTDNNAWAKMYEGIERANICIRGLRTYGDPQPGTELGYLLGEALTLRAVYYADLLKGWGDVVARFEPITTETLYLEKSSRDVIYKMLIADLEEASQLVPWPNASEATTSVERVNKAFVKGFRARLCLAASGYSQYPDGIRRSTDPDLSVAKMYAIAYQECLDVINSGTASLEASFENLWRKLAQEKISAGGESLWEIPFSDGRGRVFFTFAIRHTAVNQYTGQARGGQASPLPFMYYDYDLKDKRRDVTITPYDWTAVSGVARQQITNLSRWSMGKYRYEWMTRRVTSTNDDGINQLYMRYAEVVMMAAETANELHGPAAAAPYLKMIRKRAFDPADWPAKVEAYVDALNSKEAMFDAIVEEHKFEFCGEMLRKQALIRWNLLKVKLDEAKGKMYALRERTGEYADVPEKLYYRYADAEKLEFYGLNRGEHDAVTGYESSIVWVAPSRITDSKIQSIYARDPDKYQFWPIWQVFLDNSNGKLKNDYGY
jgi:starch-binding outer membrane protein, SusD/RagB family